MTLSPGGRRNVGRGDGRQRDGEATWPGSGPGRAGRGSGRGHSGRPGRFHRAGRLLACGQVVVLLGKRLQGRFSPQMVRYTRPILPSTIFALALTLVVAWVSPFLEWAGTTYVTALPVEIYRWFLDRGLPTWAGIIAMVPLAPIEIFFILYIFTSVVLKPLGHLLGQHNALVEALEESFGSAWIE